MSKENPFVASGKMPFVAGMPVLPWGNWISAWLVESVLIAISVIIVFLILVRGSTKIMSTGAGGPLPSR